MPLFFGKSERWVLISRTQRISRRAEAWVQTKHPVLRGSGLGGEHQPGAPEKEPGVPIFRQDERQGPLKPP